jgi:hypothetical protein
MKGASAVAAIAAVSVVASAGAWLFRPRHLRVELGAFDHPVATEGWGRADRLDVDDAAASGDRSSFYYRPLAANARLRLPFVARAGPVRVSFRGTARIRSTVDVFLGATRLGSVVVPAGRWERSPGPWIVYAAEGAAPGDGEPAVSLVVRAAPLVRRAKAELDNPELLVDRVDIDAERGLAPRGSLVAGIGLAALAAGVFAIAVGATPAAGVAAALAAGLAGQIALRAGPVATANALPRLLPVALLAAGAVALVLRHARFSRDVAPRDRARLAALVAIGIVAHGAVAFFPDHSPPDLDIHVRRTLDLGGVPLEYDAMRRYGSQLPTASQDEGAATAALGEHTLIPYSPLPYVFYYALHRAGLDLYWAMTVANAAIAMAVAALAWLAARRVFDTAAAWTAALLYSLDLAVWHHLGRSHAPAVFGGALATAALLHLAAHADALETPRSRLTAAAALALAVLGYSSLVVLIGLFGLVLLAVLALDARGVPPASRRGLAVALVVGGLLAGGLFYFHYVPGLLRGAVGVEAEPDLFPGKTFLVFHNESRQSLRLWVLGLWIPLGAGLLAAPVALRRAWPPARPILLAWLAAWALLMLFKEPWLFPKLLRWAKEDQFVSPLMALMIAGAVAAIPRPRLRTAASLVIVAVAAWLELRDFAHHANTLTL